MVSRASFVKCEVSSNTSSSANLPTIPLCRYLLYSYIVPSLKMNVYYSNKPIGLGILSSRGWL